MLVKDELDARAARFGVDADTTHDAGGRSRFSGWVFIEMHRGWTHISSERVESP